MNQLYIYTHIYVSHILFHMVYHIVLNIVPCDKKQDLVVSPIVASANPRVPILPFSTLPLSLGSHESVLYVCESAAFS